MTNVKSLWVNISSSQNHCLCFDCVCCNHYFLIQGLLSVPTAPSEDLEDVAVVSVRRSNGTLNSEFLDAGTPPPSYAEVIASCSIQNLNHVITTSGGEDASGTNIYSAILFKTL